MEPVQVMNPSEGTPKRVSSAKRASMSKSERLSAARRKKKRSWPTTKTGAAKPTYVSTDSPRKKNERRTQLNEVKDKKGKGSGKRCSYHKVKSRYSVWPSAYASGALVKCRKVKQIGVIVVRKKSLNQLVFHSNSLRKCWKGYEKKVPK